MIKKPYDSLLWDDVMFGVAESIAEFDQLAKKEGACLDQANDGVVAWDSLAKWREKVCKLIAERTSVPRKTRIKELMSTETVIVDGKEVTRKKTTEEWDESEGTYAKRAAASAVEQGLFTDVEAFAASLATDVQAIADAVGFNPAEAERKPKAPKTPRKDYLAAAQRAIDKGNGQALADRLTANLGRPIAADLTSLALAIGEDIARERAKIEKAQLATLGL